MNNPMELLAPGGDVDSIKAAIVAGADAVYCGLIRFNARNRATNLTLEQLSGILGLAHRHDCRVYLTLNTILVDSDFPELIDLLNRLANTSLDGVIVQDLGLLHLLSGYFKGLAIHASTQLTTHNAGQLSFLEKLATARVNLSRELTLDEISALCKVGQGEHISTEVFVHGSYCLSFSGLCYLSSVHGANSGNRGKCSQPCRDRYQPTPLGKEYPLNLKDNSAYFDVEALAEAGVSALKIEGRMKQFHYVHTVTQTWRKQLDNWYQQGTLLTDDGALFKVFNRGFTNGYLRADINRSMFSDNPRNHSAEHLRQRLESKTDGESDSASTEHWDEIADNIAAVRAKIGLVSAEKAPLTVSISGKEGKPLCVSVSTPDGSFIVLSESCLVPQSEPGDAQQLTREYFDDRLRAINDSEYYIAQLELNQLEHHLFVPFKDVTLIRNKILFRLNSSKDRHDHIDLPVLADHARVSPKPKLSVLISSPRDLYLRRETNADLCLQLPNSLSVGGRELIGLLEQNSGVTPWFPAILIGDDYTAGVDLLRQVKPGRIVTNNTGIALQALELGIPWIAGPELNVANSYSLQCLKEVFDCKGAFVSNELNLRQLKRMKTPADFELHYRLYHPLELMTSRQCLFHQITGCEKQRIDKTCLSQCERSASITNTKNVSFLVKKTRGRYATVYNNINALNTEIVGDVPRLICNYLVDLRDLETGTQVALGKPEVIAQFARLVDGDADSAKALAATIHPTTNTQYHKGL